MAEEAGMWSLVLKKPVSYHWIGKKIIQELPESKEMTVNVSDKLVIFHKEMRYKPSEKRIIRRKKVDVKPGCSVSLEDFEPSDDDPSADDESSMEYSSDLSNDESNDDDSISDAIETPDIVPHDEGN